MTASLSLHAVRRLKALALWLGLGALMLHGLAPLCLAGAMGSAGGDTVIICTAHGPETVRIGPDGTKLPEAPPSNDSSSDCLACLVFHGVPVLSPPPSVPPSLRQAKLDLATMVLPAVRANFPYSTRAPPPMMFILEA